MNKKTLTVRELLAITQNATRNDPELLDVLVGTWILTPEMCNVWMNDDGNDREMSGDVADLIDITVATDVSDGNGNAVDPIFELVLRSRKKNA